MKNFWRKISGQAKREKDWIDAPRRLPDAVKTGDLYFHDMVIGREFYHIGSSGLYERQYAAVIYDQDKKNWKPVVYFVSSREPHEQKCSSIDGNIKTPLEAVRFLTWWEKHCHLHMLRFTDGPSASSYLKRDWKMIEGSDETYTNFAHRHGISFDQEGAAYLLTRENMGTEDIILRGAGLHDVFARSAQDVSSYRTWQGLQDVFKTDTLSIKDMIGSTVASVTDGLEDFAKEFRSFRMGELRSASWYDNEYYNPMRDYREPLAADDAADALIEVYEDELFHVLQDACFGDVSEDKVVTAAAKAVHASMIYAMLDQGAHIYETALEGGKPLSSYDRKKVMDLGHSAASFALHYCGFTQEQSKALYDVMLDGRYPEKTYPVENMISCLSAYGFTKKTKPRGPAP